MDAATLTDALIERSSRLGIDACGRQVRLLERHPRYRCQLQRKRQRPIDRIPLFGRKRHHHLTFAAGLDRARRLEIRMENLRQRAPRPAKLGRNQDHSKD